LPFDRSGADLTAHVLRAAAAWRRGTENSTQQEPLPAAAIEQGLDYLARTQRPDGSWLPLWFGNQHVPGDENPTYGTARVLAAYRDLAIMEREPARRGLSWLLNAQNADGGWGGARGISSSIEETSLAIEVLIDMPPCAGGGQAAERERAVNRGLGWLVERVEAGGLKNPTPIGFYFAKLWYHEKMYPVIFALAALGLARRKLASLTQQE
jgi:squalene-hopene/tetraprenyl-beta-curcumene cyclase